MKTLNAPGVAHAPARVSDPETSQEAARLMDVRGSWRQVLNTVERLGACIAYDVETALARQVSPSRVRTAISELTRLQLITYTGETRPSPVSTRRCRVLTLNPDGLGGAA
ncbi:hypothetical protein [Gleimia europaea]|uniref:hypothetical protein n=1 Tax=Gleimia europaea TaxID=66228 RepID=UPI000C7FA3D3|nr:hypothetical protein [Gleimia europaea]WIK62595.1 hypothetical protein CJ185_008780 [Gleimia europaea]